MMYKRVLGDLYAYISTTIGESFKIMIGLFKSGVVVSLLAMAKKKKEKPKGGFKKREEERNEAVVTLYKLNKDYFNVSVLSRVFERDRKTIYQILDLYEIKTD